MNSAETIKACSVLEREREGKGVGATPLSLELHSQISILMGGTA